MFPVSLGKPGSVACVGIRVRVILPAEFQLLYSPAQLRGRFAHTEEPTLAFFVLAIPAPVAADADR